MTIPESLRFSMEQMEAVECGPPFGSLIWENTLQRSHPDFWEILITRMSKLRNAPDAHKQLPFLRAIFTALFSFFYSQKGGFPGLTKDKWLAIENQVIAGATTRNDVMTEFARRFPDMHDAIQAMVEMGLCGHGKVMLTIATKCLLDIF